MAAVNKAATEPRITSG